MKKLFLVFLAAASISAHSFAAEFILSPTIGFSNTGVAGIYTQTVSGYSSESKNFTMSFNHMPLGLTLGFITDKGFTFMVNNDFSVAGAGTMKGDNDSMDLKLGKNTIFQQSFILGATFKLLNEKLFINIGSGFAWGVGKITLYVEDSGQEVSFGDMWHVNLGIPLQAGAQFFFTKNIGINLLLSDAIGLAVGKLNNTIDIGLGSMTVDMTSVGASNLFNVKVGPIFKF
ncbi:DUF2715 domain-containing protein [Treponema socranskii]|uniref:DUF2715 domain-containing protein n=1 Tax=Treponema socranskii TaxID=53419 RepID=UPI003D701DED